MTVIIEELDTTPSLTGSRCLPQCKISEPSGQVEGVSLRIKSAIYWAR